MKLWFPFVLLFCWQSSSLLSMTAALLLPTRTRTTTRTIRTTRTTTFPVGAANDPLTRVMDVLQGGRGQRCVQQGRMTTTTTTTTTTALSAFFFANDEDNNNGDTTTSTTTSTATATRVTPTRFGRNRQMRPVPQAAPIAVGSKLPALLQVVQVPTNEVMRLTDAAAAAVTTNMKTNVASTLNKKKDDANLPPSTLLVGMPGAFLPTCSNQHVPQLLQAAEELQKVAGISQVLILTTNDPYVLGKWREQYQPPSVPSTTTATNGSDSTTTTTASTTNGEANQKKTDNDDNNANVKISWISDGDGDVVKALGMAYDRGFGYGTRSRRFALWVDGEGIVQKVWVEGAGAAAGAETAESKPAKEEEDRYQITAPEAILRDLKDEMQQRRRRGGGSRDKKPTKAAAAVSSISTSSSSSSSVADANTAGPVAALLLTAALAIAAFFYTNTNTDLKINNSNNNKNDNTVLVTDMVKNIIPKMDNIVLPTMTNINEKVSIPDWLDTKALQESIEQFKREQ